MRWHDRHLPAIGRLCVNALAWIAVFFGSSMLGAEETDPKFPDQVDSIALLGSTNQKPSRWPPKRIRQLEQEQALLADKLAALPELHPVAHQTRHGFHSAFDSATVKNDLGEHIIEFQFRQEFLIDTLAIAPAINALRSDSKAYAFPNRFKIEFLDDAGDFKTVVDWMGEDFPDPGELPVVFSNFGTFTRHIRFTTPVENLRDDRSFFALGEFYIWGSRRNHTQIDNVAIWDTTRVDSTNTFSLSPKWGLDYLHDGISGLGFPLQDDENSKGDLMILSQGEAELAESIEIIIDAQIPAEFGRIDLWPAQSLDGPMLSGIGFPENVEVEVSNDPDFNNFRAIESTTVPDRGMNGALYSACIRPPEVRYIKVTLSGLQELDTKRILGLGEIAIYNTEGNLVKGQIHSVKGVPDRHHEQLDRLIDGYCWGKRIIPDLQWLKGLAQRRPLERRLAQIENELLSTQTIWRYLQYRILIAVGVLVIVAFVVVVIVHRVQQKWVLLKQGDRITRDLHDEVGSSLGSISLLADDLAESSESSDAKSDLNDLSLMAREANASLSEIVNKNDQKPLSLEALLKAIQGRAERVLRGMEVCANISATMTGVEVLVSQNMKRHILMFFKEVIHNCAKHSAADRVELSASCTSSDVVIAIKDDGCGFDVNENFNGWGLKNLNQRAEDMRCKCSIVSTKGCGTTVQLQIPLSMLPEEPQNTYKTSNL